MKSRRTTRRILWLVVQSTWLTTWLCLAPASSHPATRDPPVPRDKLPMAAERSGDPTGDPLMFAQASSDSPASAGRPSGSESAARRKVRVTDPEVGRQLIQAGSRMIADYGGFQVLDVDEPTAAALAGQEGIEVHHEWDLIMLNTGAMNTAVPQLAAQRALVGAFPGKRLHLIQFAAPVQEAWLDSVRKTGARIIAYIPSNAYLVYGEAVALAKLQTMARTHSSVQWDGAYLDDYRIHPRARTINEQGAPQEIGTEHFAIQMVEDSGPNAATLAVINSLKLAPILSQHRTLGYLNVIARLPAGRLADIARQPEVVSIQPYFVPRLLDERQDQIMAGNVSGAMPSGPGYLAWLASKGFTQEQFTASGFAVDVSDDGLDDGTTAPNNPNLYENGDQIGRSRVAYVRREPPGTGEIRGCPGHGNLNAHIVAGYNNLSAFPHIDATGFHYGLGVAPFATVGSSVIFDPDNFTFPDYEDLQSRAYRDGARISTNSWGTGFPGYSFDSQRYDALVRDAQPVGSAVPAPGNQQMSIVFAAGNRGPASNTVGSPGTGKNVFTVGASENVHSHSSSNGGDNPTGNDGCSIPDTGADSLSDISFFSSRGPTTDGRVRPDIVAPGTHVTGGVFQIPSPPPLGMADACFNASEVCGLPTSNFFPLGQQFYTTSSGTSHSTPAVAGGAALVRQWFINQGMSPASPAMTKAFLMNSARYLTGAGANDTLPSSSQGMGLMDLGRAFDSTPRIFRDQVDLFTATGQSFTWTGTISDASKPFRVTLAWTDAPGSTVGNAFNNDLDLVVVAGGNVYKGNVFSGPNSVTGGSADRRNNVESVFLPAGITGSFAVIVTAANINSDGVPNNASPLDQDFALVIYNGEAATVPVLAGQSVVTTGGNVSIDPNDCVGLNVVLKNWGTAAATGVSMNLRTNTPGVKVTQASSAYPNIGPGASGTNTTPFQISTAPSFACGAIVILTALLTTQQESLVFPVGIASSSGSIPRDFASKDVPKAIPDLSTVESVATVSGITGPVDRVTVSVFLTHTFDSDLVISLVAPDGTTVTLSSRNGGGGANYGTSCSGRTVFDDTAATSITTGFAPFVGTFRPQRPLSVFAGRSGSAVNGIWKLRISDVAAVDVGTLFCWTVTVDSTSCSSGTGACQPPSPPRPAHDFDGDTKADILWRHSSGLLYTWFMDGVNLRAADSPGSPSTEWTVQAIGDFNGDGKADILWRHTSGLLYIWLMDGIQVIGAASPGSAPPDWTIQAVADFNGDSKADILWQHTSGLLYVWLMDGLNLIAAGSPGSAPAGLTVAGVADLDGDRQADIVWRNAAGAAVSVWFMDGTGLISSASLPSAGSGWTTKAIGDFNGDGKADLLWMHSSGLLYIWLMNGASVIGAGSPTSVGPGWAVQGPVDFNGDGKADLLWRHSSGLLYIWLMNGLSISGVGQLPSVDSDWAVQ